jgi:SSS family solute:Na+ symporter
MFRLIVALTLSLALCSAASGQDDFTRLPDLPNPIGLGGPIAGASNGALIVAGGASFPIPLSQGGSKVWHDQSYVLLSANGEWQTGTSLPRPLAYAACVNTNYGIAVLGGSDEHKVYADAFLIIWDEVAQQLHFEDLPPLPSASALGAAEVIGSTIYALGGKESKNESDLSGGFWSLDLKNREKGWQSLPKHPGPARSKMVTAVQSGPNGEQCLFMFSGSSTGSNADSNPFFTMFVDGYRFSPTSQAWTGLADLPVLDDPRPILGKHAFADQPWPINAGTAHAFGENQILTFSGSTGRYILDANGEIAPASARPNFLKRVLLYDTVDDRWSEAGDMHLGVVTTQAFLWNRQIVIPSGEVKPGIRTPMVQSIALPMGQAVFATIDYLVLGIYLMLMVAIGIYFAKRDKTTEDFFLGGRKIPWWAAGLSIFGTQLSAITFMAIPATAYGSDWRRFMGSIMLLPVLVIVIFCFLPFFRRLQITTAYEYLQARFSRSIRLIASGLFILFQFGRMGIVLLLPAIALSAVTQIDTYLCIALMGMLATIYTALGGISAVIWTDVLQVFVLIGGALLCLIIAISDAGGVQQSVEIAVEAHKFHMLDWQWNATDMVAWVLIIGFFFTNLVPYTTDQTVIQRYLTTRDEKSAARSLWLNLAVTLPTGFLFYGLGTALFAYYQLHPMEAAMIPEKVDQLVPWFVVTHLPAGLAGLIVAGIFAAAMSSLDSSMNSITTTVVSDFMDSRASAESRSADFPSIDSLSTESLSPGNHLGFARKLTVVLGVIGTTAAMILATYEIKYLFDFFQKVVGLFGGGVAGVFILAVFTKRANSTGALVGLAAGGAATLFAAFFTEINFLLYAAIGCSVCVVVGYGLSLVVGAQDRDLTGLTMWTRSGVQGG